MKRKKFDLGIGFGGLQFKNPIISTSGTCGYAFDYLPRKVLGSIGGVTLKALSPEAKAGNPFPRVCETEAGFLNSIGLQNSGLQHFVREVYPCLGSLDCKVIANLVGDSVSDFVLLATELSRLKHVDLLELNLSCPNTKRSEATFDVDPRDVFEIVSRCARVPQAKPIVAKLSPFGAARQEIVLACEEAGAVGLSIANTFPAMKIDVKQRRSMLSKSSGGYSGVGTKPIVLNLVHRASSWCDLPIIAMGGVRSGRDVVEYLLAGATLVGVGTQTLIDPFAPSKILAQYGRHLRRQGASSRDLVGALRHP